MITDARLGEMLTTAQQQESAVRMHLTQTKDSAGEQARGTAAYRHAVALRRSLEEWIATREYRARQGSGSI